MYTKGIHLSVLSIIQFNSYIKLFNTRLKFKKKVIPILPCAFLCARNPTKINVLHTLLHFQSRLSEIIYREKSE